MVPIPNSVSNESLVLFAFLFPLRIPTGSFHGTSIPFPNILLSIIPIISYSLNPSIPSPNILLSTICMISYSLHPSIPFPNILLSIVYMMFYFLSPSIPFPSIPLSIMYIIPISNSLFIPGEPILSAFSSPRRPTSAGRSTEK